MKAIQIHNYGSSEQLKFEETRVPLMKNNEIFVKVFAASVNHLDIKIASGAMKDKSPLNFPWIPGYDFAGIIKSVGSSVENFKEGDEIFGNCSGGSYAEFLTIDISKVAKKPGNLSFTAAASVPHVAETAWQAIYTHGKLKKGQKILIHGSAGAVGSYAIQFAHKSGAFVYATASEENRTWVESLGADHFIDYRKTDFTSIVKDIDLVVDLVGGETQQKSYSVIKKGGRLITTVGLITPDEIKKYGIYADHMVIKQSGQDLQKISDMLSEGEITTDVNIVLPLEKASEAWDIITNKKDRSLPKLSHGKIVLEVFKSK